MFLTKRVGRSRLELFTFHFDFLGTVSIDRHYTKPFFSHLLTYESTLCFSRNVWVEAGWSFKFSHHIVVLYYSFQNCYVKSNIYFCLEQACQITPSLPLPPPPCPRPYPFFDFLTSCNETQFSACWVSPIF